MNPSTHQPTNPFGILYRFRGCYFEDSLSGAWMRLWGSNITDVPFNKLQHYQCSANLTLDAEVLTRNARDIVVFHQRKDIGEFLHLYNSVMLKYNSFAAGIATLAT
jgi:hypothetical protein